MMQLIENLARYITKNKAQKFVVGTVMVTAALVSGCATNMGGQLDANNLELQMKDADAEVAKGRNDEAIVLLKQAAKEHPTSMMPWLKMANISFEAGDYPSAITAATEVLQRDANNQDAKSLLVVAGLRVAAGAVSGLRSDGSVVAATRMEAEELTDSLRSVLGEKDLVPSPQAASRTTRPSQRSRPAVRRASTPAAASSQDQKPSNGGADPFRLLK